jgi:hypothetical protein
MGQYGQQAVASYFATQEQKKANEQAIAEQQREFNAIQSSLSPWVSAGQWGIGQMQQGLQPGGQFSQQFGPAQLNSGLAPSYGFELGQVQASTKANAAATGGIGSGNLGVALQNRAMNVAQTGYQQAWSNFYTQQQQSWNYYNQISNAGQSAAVQTAQAQEQLSTVPLIQQKGDIAANFYNTEGATLGAAADWSTQQVQNASNTATSMYGMKGAG